MRAMVSPGTGQRYPVTMMCAVFRATLDRLTGDRVGAGRAGRPEKAGAEDEDERSQVRRGDSGDPRGDAVPSRGLSEGPGALGPSRPRRRRQACAAPHAARAPGATPAAAAERLSGARRHDRHGAARRDVGGTDATRFYTKQDGRDRCWFFGAIDHHIDETVGWHTAKLSRGRPRAPPAGGAPCVRPVR